MQILDGFAPAARATDFQDDLEDFTLSAAASDIGDAFTASTIPTEAVVIGAVVVIGFVYVVVVLLAS